MAKYEYRNHLYALILAGGGGTRLWPKSRNETPKQFLQLFGNKTLIEITAERLNTFLNWDRIFVVTTTDNYGKIIQKLLPQLPKKNIIVEPVRRDSAPAHGLGALYIKKQDPDAVIINAASDHFLSPVSLFKKTMYAAANVAYKSDVLVAVGIRPTYPHTGMGHIKIGQKLEKTEGRTVYELAKFVEKPPLPIAKRYTSSGNYLWNANQYVWRADSILKALELYEPGIGKALASIEPAIGTSSETRIVREEYEKMPKISIDYAVSERAKNLRLLVGEYTWTDIGDWKEVWSNLSKDNQGNVVISEHKDAEIINIDTSDALIHTNGRMIAVIDVDNIVVIDTEDALLVCSKSKAQNVKQIVELLKEQKKDRYL